MITSEFRPKTFEEVAGQDLNKRILKAIIANPEQSPRSLILYGGFGQGKTTTARIFAKALNCESSSHRPCGKCKSCLEDINNAPYYAEYDSASMGNVDKIRELRDTFSYTMVNGWKVNVLDEAHLMSATAQSALLKVIEEAPPRVFFIFATTDADKLLKTIRSRSLELRYDGIPREDMVENLKQIAQKTGSEIPEDIFDIIARKSRGHMRNAHMLLDKFMMIGEKDFRESVKSSHSAFYKFFLSVAKKDKQLCFKAIDEILTFPLAELQVDYQEVVSDISKTMVGYKTVEEAKPVIELLKSDTLKLVKASIADWLISSFNSDVNLQTALLCFYQMMTQALSVTAPSSGPAPMNRNMARR